MGKLNKQTENGKESYHQRNLKLPDKRAQRLLLQVNIGILNSMEPMFVDAVVQNYSPLTPNMTVVADGRVFLNRLIIVL